MLVVHSLYSIYNVVSKTHRLGVLHPVRASILGQRVGVDHDEVRKGYDLHSKTMITFSFVNDIDDSDRDIKKLQIFDLKPMMYTFITIQMPIHRSDLGIIMITSKTRQKFSKFCLIKAEIILTYYDYIWIIN